MADKIKTLQSKEALIENFKTTLISKETQIRMLSEEISNLSKSVTEIRDKSDELVKTNTKLMKDQRNIIELRESITK